MHRGMRHETEAIGLVFFLIFYMFSVYGICNLFICVILAAFEMEEDEKDRRSKMMNTHTHTHSHTHVYADKSHHNYNSSEFRVYYHIDTCGVRYLRVAN